jgi:hypothetical protein
MVSEKGHMSEVDAAKSLGDMQRIAAGAAFRRIDPAAIAKSTGIHDERITHPGSSGVAEPCRGIHLGRRPPIGEDLAEDHPH